MLQRCLILNLSGIDLVVGLNSIFEPFQDRRSRFAATHALYQKEMRCFLPPKLVDVTHTVLQDYVPNAKQELHIN